MYKTYLTETNQYNNNVSGPLHKTEPKRKKVERLPGILISLERRIEITIKCVNLFRFHWGTVILESDTQNDTE